MSNLSWFLLGLSIVMVLFTTYIKMGDKYGKREE